MQTPTSASAATPLSSSAKKISRLIQFYEQTTSPAPSPAASLIGKKRSFIQTAPSESTLPESPPKRQKVADIVIPKTPGSTTIVHESEPTTPRSGQTSQADDSISSAQKKKSGIVDKPRMEASFEILTSERTYVDTLDQFVKVRNGHFIALPAEDDFPFQVSFQTKIFQV
jgi:hypothetical protein